MVSAELINKLIKVALYLRNNFYNTEAKEIEDILKQLQDVNTTQQEVYNLKEEIINKCDIRWLGDIYIKEISNPYEWWNLLGSIKSLAKKL